LCFASQQESLAVLLDLGELQVDQVADHVFPLQLATMLGESVDPLDLHGSYRYSW